MMAYTRPENCSGPSCTTPVAGWRRLFHWPLFLVLAAVHLTVLPLVLAGDDRVIALLGGAFYLVLAILDWTRRHRSPALR